MCTVFLCGKRRDSLSHSFNIYAFSVVFHYSELNTTTTSPNISTTTTHTGRWTQSSVPVFVNHASRSLKSSSSGYLWQGTKTREEEALGRVGV